DDHCPMEVICEIPRKVDVESDELSRCGIEVFEWREWDVRPYDEGRLWRRRSAERKVAGTESYPEQDDRDDDRNDRRNTLCAHRRSRRRSSSLCHGGCKRLSLFESHLERPKLERETNLVRADGRVTSPRDSSIPRAHRGPRRGPPSGCSAPGCIARSRRRKAAESDRARTRLSRWRRGVSR